MVSCPLYIADTVCINPSVGLPVIDRCVVRVGALLLFGDKHSEIKVIIMFEFD